MYSVKKKMFRRKVMNEIMEWKAGKMVSELGRKKRETEDVHVCARARAFVLARNGMRASYSTL